VTHVGRFGGAHRDDGAGRHRGATQMIPAWRGPRRPKSSRRSPGMEPRRRPPSGEERDGRTGFPRAGPWPATRGRVSCSGNPVAFASQAWTGGGRPARSAPTRSSPRMPRASGSPNRPGRPSVTSLCASYFRSCATARCPENEAPSPASRPESSRERESPESGQLNSLGREDKSTNLRPQEGAADQTSLPDR
jgi:hypothetical protein